jgi:hypothetical protein
VLRRVQLAARRSARAAVANALASRSHKALADALASASLVRV